MQQGSINVQTENIFPIIKKFLYSDHEIFLRELVSNAVDASQKVKTLKGIGELNADPNKLKVEVILNKAEKTLTIRDNGIGMTEEEVNKYINQIAFSGAEEFVNKYKDAEATNAIIGHFGLGFYSAFMVAAKVEIISRSQKPNSEAVRWECDGSPNYTMEAASKKTKGTDIILHIAEDSEEFLEEERIRGILNKYCKFMPVSIIFGKKSITEDDPSGEKDEEGKVLQITKQVDDIINNPSPAWMKKPVDLTDEDYTNFYRELYPMQMEDPLFHIHLNVDYPFNLTGILFFPRLKQNVELQRNKIHLYSNQVFITDNVENIVPDFLTLLHGVIDSPDIPLNVSRSYLQEDGNVKKISSHITKKVADKLKSMFNENREDFESKWDDIRMFIDYGMLTDEKFFERSLKFALLKNTDGKAYTFDEMKAALSATQQDKNNKTVVLYTTDAEGQHERISKANERGYEVMILDGPLAAHITSKMEQHDSDLQFKRVDADILEKLIERDEELESKLSEEQQNELKPVVEEVANAEKFDVSFASMSVTDQPMVITENEFMRRMKEQQAAGGGGFQMFGAFPEKFNLVVNSNHPLIERVVAETDADKRKDLVKQLTDLARLSHGILKGEELTKFVARSVDLMN
ncbi:MAG: molecular chaperone HtpG [Flavobacteriales bacterium]|nr:molecular chaperone HtpG [Flavobacteriales bacterium]MDG1780405.1 molecular chaperone HtpG [Flavobacteriales bacterium]MDG2245852.1 molecular chaperone HtpG [Flavobacteriales bacterium]